MKEIELTKDRVVLVDDSDFEWLNQYKWHICNGYASRYGKGGRKNRKRIYMHQILMPTEDGMEVDHINRNRLDNQRHNLRTCTRAQNHMNMFKMRPKTTSRYKGVSRRKCNNKKIWQVFIKFNGKSRYVGIFAIEEDAARAYNKAATKYFGEFALLNALE